MKEPTKKGGVEEGKIILGPKRKKRYFIPQRTARRIIVGGTGSRPR